MITNAILLSLLLFSPQRFGMTDGPIEWHYLADNAMFELAMLSEADVVAIVEARANTEPATTREWRATAMGETIPPMKFAVDHMTIVHSAIGGLSGPIRVVYPITTHQERNAPPPSVTIGKRYLLIGRKIQTDELVFPDMPHRYSIVGFNRVEGRATNEVSGFAILPTRSGQVAEATDTGARVLLSVGEAFRNADDADVRRLVGALRNILVDRADIAGRPLLGIRNPDGWLQADLAPLIREALPTLTSYGRAKVWALLVGWKIPDSVEPYLDELEAADADGYRFDAPRDWVTPQMANLQRDPNRITDAVLSISHTGIRDWLILRMTGPPSNDLILLLVELLEVPRLRYTLFTKFAGWADRPDLKPRYLPETYPLVIENEEGLLQYWRANPPLRTGP